jgi:hypothetical protein
MNSKLRLIILGGALIVLSVVPLAGADVYTQKTLYVDGVKVGDGNSTISGLTWPNDDITIGAEGSRGGWLYNEYVGKIDDFAIYAGQLTPAQVAAHWAARGDYPGYQAAVQADNPLLWLKLDEADVNNGMVAYNSGSVDINGIYVVNGPNTIKMGTTAGFVAGSNGVQLNVNGRVAELGDANGVCVSVPDADGDFSSELQGDVTIEMWVNYTDLNGFPTFFQHNGAYDALGGYGIIAQLNDGNSLVVTGGNVSNYVDFNDDINDGDWHHIVVAYDSNYPPLPPPVPYPNAVALDNPVLWLRFEDEEPKDYSVADGNHWVGYGAGSSIVEKVGGIGKSCYLNGATTANYVAAKNDPNPPPLVEESYSVYGDEYAFAPNDITFELWYRVPADQSPLPDPYCVYFQQTGPGGRDNGPAVTNRDAFCVLAGGPWWTGVSPKFDGKWHQLVVTFDEEYGGEPNTLHIDLYLDSELKTFRTSTGATAKLGPELSHVMLGGRPDIGYTYNNFAGYVDEFAIYEGILNPNRILAHWVAWQPKSCEEAVERGIVPAAWAVVDKKQDCRIDFYDFAIFAQDWALCNDPQGGAGCVPNW